jgi:hypothetical protein
MVKIEGFSLVGVCGVSKLPILLMAAIGRSMPDHELSISNAREQMLQAIDHYIMRARIFLSLTFSSPLSVVFFLLLPPLLPVIHGSIISIVIIHFVPTGVARWTPHLIVVFFTVQYVVVQASMYFFVSPMSMVTIVSLQGKCWWANYSI